MSTALTWCPVIDIRLVPVPTAPGCARLCLRLINKTPRRKRTYETEFVDPNLYAVDIQVVCPTRIHRSTTFVELPRSYRYNRTIPAVGINCDIETHQDEGVLSLRTRSIPRKVVPRLEPRELQAETTPTFTALAADPLPLLRGILDEMRRYDATTWTAKLAALSGGDRQDAEDDRNRFKDDEIAAFERGIHLLDDPVYPQVRRAFAFMNEAMIAVANGRYDRWHLFQIVFIVSQLPGLASRAHPELEQIGDDAVEILWFAAGGGKTEAFLGLLLWQLFWDRLRGKSFGVTAMVRFPLRLLTFQQLKRMARALAAAEVIRDREKLVGARFSLGYFVGHDTIPNSIDDDRHARYKTGTIDDKVHVLRTCPFCGAPTAMSYDPEVRLVQHWCSRKATCPGGNKYLPLYVIDYDIYYYLPSVVVSTVDKLALLGQNQRFANLFGRISLLCGRHGASFLDVEKKRCAAAASCDGRSTNHPAACAGAKVFYPPFLDPGPSLLIQDELHLLSEETGAFDGHYETAAMETMRSLGHRPWKIIAATATIENYAHHARHLYLKPARQFPAPGPEAYESFYYQLNQDKIGRIFVGVLGVGRKHTPSVTRLQSLTYQEIQTARDLSRDPAALAVRYNLPPLTPDELTELIFRYELVLTYVLTRKGGDQIAEAIQSRVKKEIQELMPQHGALAVQTFSGGVDIGEMVEAMDEIETADPDLSPEERVRGVVATNIISHGVDINRFNIIVFGGFTRLVAEYIQASARVGRTFPGISFFVTTPQSDRDRSIFERFAKFHEYLDRLVDPSAINRWPPQALERTISGVLAGYLMAVAAATSDRRLDTVSKVLRSLGQPHTEALEPDNVVAWMKEAYGTAQADYPSYERALETIVRNRYAQITNAPPVGLPYDQDQLRAFLGAMRSLRDIDDPGYIRLQKADTPLMRVMRRSIRRS